MTTVENASTKAAGKKPSKLFVWSREIFAITVWAALFVKLFVFDFDRYLVAK